MFDLVKECLRRVSDRAGLGVQMNFAHAAVVHSTELEK